MKKWMSMLFVVVVSLMVFVVGCSSSNNQNNNTGGSNTTQPSPTTSSGNNNGGEVVEEETGFKLGEEPLHITFYKNRDAMDMPWGEDPVSQWITENKKVTIDWIQSNGNARQKLNTLVVGRDLPDAIKMGTADMESFADAGDIVPIDDFITEDTNMYKLAGGMLDMLRAQDGNLYLIPDWFISGENGNGNGGWIINSKIYKELGSPKLETTEDLENYLRLVQKEYPDVVPLEMQLDWLYNGLATLYTAFGEERVNFLYENQVYVDGDSLKPITEDPAFKEMVLYASQLFRDKLITQDLFTQKWDQVREKVKQQRIAVLASKNVISAANVPNAEIRAVDPEAGYDMLWPIRKEGLDKDKIYPNTFNRLGSGGAVITTNAENPEAVFAYLDWTLGEEGQRTLWFGPPGLYWDEYDEDGSPLATPAYMDSDAAKRAQDGLGEHIIVGNTTFVDSSKFKRELTLPEEKRSWGVVSQMDYTFITSMDVTQFANIYPAGNTDEGIIHQSVQDIFDQALAQMIYAQNDDEVLSILDKANQDMKAAGMDDLVAYMQGVWEENKRALGIN